MEVRNSAFGAFIDVFTPNTYVMVIMSDSSIRKYSALSFIFLINMISCNKFKYFTVCLPSQEWVLYWAFEIGFLPTALEGYTGKS